MIKTYPFVLGAYIIAKWIRNIRPQYKWIPFVLQMDTQETGTVREVLKCVFFVLKWGLQPTIILAFVNEYSQRSIIHFGSICLHLLNGCSTHHNTPQHTATHRNIFNTLQHTATYCNALQHTATHCNVLQHTATHCNTLQHAATHCNTPQYNVIHCKTLQHSATLCNTLQHTAIHCN